MIGIDWAGIVGPLIGVALALPMLRDRARWIVRARDLAADNGLPLPAPLERRVAG